MKVSKSKMAALTARLKGAAARVRAAKSTDLGEVGLAVGTGIAGGVASSYAIGMIPVPAGIPRPALVKSLVQCAAGIAVAVMVKHKLARYAGAGAGIIGGMGVARELFPIPTMAGEVDQVMYGEPLGEPLGYVDIPSADMMGMASNSSWTPHG